MSPELKELLSLVNQQYRFHHQPAYYASRLGIHAAQLNKLCRLELGINVRDIVAGKVMERAEAMLGSRSTADIAWALGFSTPEAFRKFFQRHSGSSITEYRRTRRTMH
jgi:AraC family transcriptional activator of pobA